MCTPDKSTDDDNNTDEASSSCGGYVPIQTGRSNYSPTTLADEQTNNRINLAEERLKWEEQQQERNSLEKHYNTVSGIKKNIDDGSEKTAPRSALSARMANSKGGDPFVSSMVEGDLGGSRDVDDLVEFAQDKKELQSAMSSSSSSSSSDDVAVNTPRSDFASKKASELIARAGAG